MAANLYEGEAELTLAGTKHILRMNFRALATYQSELGTQWQLAVANAMANVDADKLALIVAAAIDDPDVDKDYVLQHADNAMDLCEAVGLALNRALWGPKGPPKVAKKKAKTAAKPKTKGTRSKTR